MRHHPMSTKIWVSLTLALIGLTNWTSILAQPFSGHAATGSLSRSGYSPYLTSPDPGNRMAATKPASIESDETSRARAAERYGKLPLRFEANQGQTDPRVKFFSRASHYALFLTSTESVFVMDAPDASASATRRRRVSLRMKLAGADPNAEIQGLDEQPGKTSYFIGNDASRWRVNIPSYAAVQYKSVYPGVDQIYYGNQGQVEFDFVVAPGADYKKIQLMIEGAKEASIDANGDLVLTTSLGEVRQRKPFVYQEADGARRAVNARYVFKAERQVGFEIGQYDITKPLIIDPVLDYATYLGGTEFDESRDIVIDGGGNAYVTGRTFSFNFPVTIDAFDTTYANSTDIFVTKLNATGSNLIYSTYLGGNNDDNGFGISVDSTGNAYVTGSTSSSDYPTTPGAFQTTFRGGSFPGDGLVTKLNGTGTALVYSTFLGGANSDQAAAIAVDSTGNAYVTGYTFSTNFPTTPGAFQTTNAGGSFPFGDAFITKLNPAGSAPVYSTFLGGTGSDQGTGIVIDGSGRAFVTGSTNSPDFDVTVGAFQTTFGGTSSQFGGLGDAYVTQLNDTGTALVYSTFVGGLTDDEGRGIALNSSGEAFITGATTSFNYPVTPGVVRVADGGAARSTNAAASWAAINNGLTDSTILSLAVDPTTPSVPSIVYAGTNMSGVFKSTNGGGNWTAINSGLTNLVIQTLAIDPATPSTLYLGTNSRGVFKSTDGGASWRGVNTGQGGSDVNALVINPSNTSVIYAGTNSGVFKSTNGGANWTPSNTGLINNTFIHTLAIDPVNTSNLYAGTFSGVFVTRNAGQNWTATSLSSGTIRTLQVDPLAPANVYAGGDGGVFKSTDTGTTWQGVNTGLTNRTVNTIAINPASPNIIYVGTGNGVFKSTNGGGNWSPSNTGLAGSVVNALAIDPAAPATLYAGTAFGSTDAFVTRLNSTGTQLVYSTFLGGSSSDNGNSIAVDSANNAYVTGQTNSSNFPTTPATFQSLSSSFDGDAFVTKLDPAGAGLGYSTYLGGNDGDQGTAITINSSGNAYVAGVTESRDFPVTPGAYQTLLGGVGNSFTSDGFVVKLNQTPTLSSDLSITLTGPSGTLTASSSASYNITITNNGPDPAFAIQVTDVLSPFTTFSFCSANFNSCLGAGNTVTLTLNTLASGQSATASIFTTVNCSMPNGSTITNMAAVESQTPDPNTSNNMATVSNAGSNPPRTLSPTSEVFSAGGGSGSVFVSSSTSCAWTAVSNVSWITINFSSNCCSGNVNYTVAANPGRPRVGTLTIADNTFTVFQAGAPVSTTIGVYDSANRTFYLRNSNSPGLADLTIQYGPPSSIPIVGDWDGNLTTTIGVYDPANQTFYLRNSNTVGFADITIQYGPPGCLPISGDWDGNGTVTIGVYDPSSQTFYLRNNNTPGAADITIQYGPPGVVPIVGDWDGDGTATIGVYDSANRTFYLRNSNTAGPADLTIQYGPPGATPVVGDWDGNGTVTLGAYDPASQTFYLRNSNTAGFADLTIMYGPPGASPLAGDWNGQ